MNRNEQTARVKAVRAYLEGIGMPISSVQAYEVLARSLGLKSKHVLASLADTPAATQPTEASAGAPKSIVIDGQTVPVMALTDEPYTVARMRELDWKFDVIVPFALDQLDGTDAMNDYASQRITGSDYALESIGYNHVPEVNYGKGWVAYRVTGHVSSPEDIFEEEADDQEAQFYRDLLEMADRIKVDALVTIVDQGFARAEVIWRVSADAKALLREYARTQGANNEQVNVYGQEPVFESRGREGASKLLIKPVRLMDLKYARKVADKTFEFEFGTTGRMLTMCFDD